MLVVKKPRRLYGDVFFYIKGVHLLKVNQLIQTLIKIDPKVSKAIQLYKRCQFTVLKNITRLLQKENGFETLLCFVNKDVSCENIEKATRRCVLLHQRWTPLEGQLIRIDLDQD
jgi:hypothetical protein